MTGKALIRHRAGSLLLVAVAFFAIGCRQDMHDQPKIEPLEENAFFEDRQGARQLPAGTVARGHLRIDQHLYEGKGPDGQFLDALPASIELDRALLERGRNRFEIYCTPCHDQAGSGRGMIVRRGFKQPQPFWEPRLQAMPLGYFFDVMTNGFGVMSSYAAQVPVEDRWAIAAYVRTLQMSQAMPVAELAELQVDFESALEEAADTEADDGHGGGHGGDHGGDQRNTDDHGEAEGH